MDSRLAVVVCSAPPSTSTIAGGRPDVLAPVGNRSILERCLVDLRDGGLEDVVLVVDRANGDRVRDVVRDGSALELNVEYVELTGWYGWAHAIACAGRGRPGCSVLAQSGAALVGEPVRALVDRFASGRLDALVPGAPAPAGPEPGEFAILGPAALRAIADLRPNWRGELDIREALGRVAAAGGAVEEVDLGRWWRLDGTSDSLLAGNRLVLDDLRAERRGGTMDGSRIEGRVDIHPTAIVTSSVIQGPVAIAEGARVSDAFVGPFTAIGAGVTIDGAEIENSVVMAGATVQHVAVRLAACVIGRDARVFRTFALPRTTRVLIGDSMEVAFA